MKVFLTPADSAEKQLFDVDVKKILALVPKGAFTAIYCSSHTEPFLVKEDADLLWLKLTTKPELSHS